MIKIKDLEDAARVAETAIENLRFAATRDYDDELSLALTGAAIQNLERATKIAANARRPLLPGS